MNGYGFLGGHKITPLPREPLPHVSTLRARLQSERTRNGVVPPLPSESEAIAHYMKRPSRHRVTVPDPRNDQCRPASQTPQSSPPVVAVRAGSNLPSVGGMSDPERAGGRQSLNDEANR